MTDAMEPGEHLDWAKDRALELLDCGLVVQAVSSMLFDLGKHEALHQAGYGDMGITGTDVLIEHAGKSGALQAAEVRRWIENFKWPPEGMSDAT
jgi:hypothetical protein